MEMNIGSRLKHAWNAFLNRDPPGSEYHGGGYSYRPDRMRFSRGSERTIINAINNRISLDASSIKINHVKLDENNRFDSIIDSGLNYCLTTEANADQTGRGLIQDIVMTFLEEGVAAVIPEKTNFDPRYYANIQHEPCKAVLHELLEKSGLSDELRIITEDLMDEIFKTFEMDVSRFSDEDIEAMMNGKVDPFMNMGVPKELLTGEKMLAKGADIGNQLAQNIGITFPYRIDNYCKIVCGMKHQDRYSDDIHIIHRSKEVLLKVLEGVKTIAAEYGLILNEKKTHICKLSGEYRYLQVKYTLLQNGIVVRRIHPKAITRERRKLKAYKRLLDKGIVTMEEIDGYFRSWLSGNYKYMSRDQIYKMNSLYVKLFGRSVTWKKGHGRLRWLMAHPSAA